MDRFARNSAQVVISQMQSTVANFLAISYGVQFYKKYSVLFHPFDKKPTLDKVAQNLA